MYPVSAHASTVENGMLWDNNAGLFSKVIARVIGIVKV